MLVYWVQPNRWSNSTTKFSWIVSDVYATTATSNIKLQILLVQTPAADVSQPSGLSSACMARSLRVGCGQHVKTGHFASALLILLSKSCKVVCLKLAIDSMHFNNLTHLRLTTLQQRQACTIFHSIFVPKLAMCPEKPLMQIWIFILGWKLPWSNPVTNDLLSCWVFTSLHLWLPAWWSRGSHKPLASQSLNFFMTSLWSWTLKGKRENSV